MTDYSLSVLLGMYKLVLQLNNARACGEKSHPFRVLRKVDLSDPPMWLLNLNIITVFVHSYMYLAKVHGNSTTTNEL